MFHYLETHGHIAIFVVGVFYCVDNRVADYFLYLVAVVSEHYALVGRLLELDSDSVFCSVESVQLGQCFELCAEVVSGNLQRQSLAVDAAEAKQLVDKREQTLDIAVDKVERLFYLRFRHRFVVVAQMLCRPANQC